MYPNTNRTPSIIIPLTEEPQSPPNESPTITRDLGDGLTSAKMPKMPQMLLYKTLWDNKLMENTALSVRPPLESVCLTVSEQDRTSTTSKRKRRLRFRPVLISNLVLIVIVIASLYLLEFGPVPTIRLGFYCNDQSLSFPYRGDTVSISLMLGGSFVGALITIASIEFYREREISKKYGRIIGKWLLDYTIGFLLNLTLVEMAKVIVGEHRPHFFDTCVPDGGQVCAPGEYVDQFKCTNTFYSNYIITDSSRSFPSGHTSISLYTSIFCASYLHYRLPPRNLDIVVKPLIIAIIFAWSFLCSFTRISDHRHHWWDVAAGALLGVVLAYYIIVAYCKSFQLPFATAKPHRPSSSTTTLLDVKNKDATSVII